jgi:hypothetical protein
MTCCRQLGATTAAAALCLLALLGTAAVAAQQTDASAVIRGIDASVQNRLDNVMGYSVTEHYAVYRNNDETHPVAEMTVKTVYQEDTGKSYTILSQSGSEILRKLVLGGIMDNEKRMNLPGIREKSWLTSANYEMKLKPGGTQQLDGRNCLVLSLSPRQKAPYLLDGTLWVDVADDSIVQLQGIASKIPSLFTGPTQMMRQYTSVSGFAMATHARAESDSSLFGRTVVTIDYRDYQLQLRSTR